MGSLLNIDLPLGNDGSLAATGEARIEGSEAFRVYPTTFTAQPGSEDGLVVTFAPTAEGEAVANLILTSNDPGQPEIVIPLIGNAEVNEDVPGTDETIVTKPLDGCGCHTGGSGAPLALLAAAGLLLAGRRR